MSHYTHENVPEEIAKKFPGLQGKQIITKEQVPAHVLESVQKTGKPKQQLKHSVVKTIPPHGTTATTTATVGGAVHQVNSTAVHHPHAIATSHLKVPVVHNPKTPVLGQTTATKTTTTTTAAATNIQSTTVPQKPIVHHVSHKAPVVGQHKAVAVGSHSKIVTNDIHKTANFGQSQIHVIGAQGTAPVQPVVVGNATTTVNHAATTKITAKAAYTHENVPEDIHKRFPTLNNKTATITKTTAVHGNNYTTIKSPEKLAHPQVNIINASEHQQDS